MYEANQNATKLAPLTCVLVRCGTFSTIFQTVLITDRVSPVQIKPHR
jgi:hypothetical protein